MEQMNLMSATEIPSLRLEPVESVMSWDSEQQAFWALYRDVGMNRGVTDAVIAEECGIPKANLSKVKSMPNHGLHNDVRWKFQNLCGSLGLEQYQLHKLGHRPISYREYSDMKQKIQSLEEENVQLKRDLDQLRRMMA